MIDPNQYLRTAITSTGIGEQKSNSRAIYSTNKNVVDEKIIQEILEEYLSIKQGQGKRNHGLFVCGVKLRSAGLSTIEIEEKLYLLAGEEEKIKKRVKYVISSLFKK